MFIFPYQIGRRLQHVPWVTIALIAANVVASVAFFFVMFRVVTDVVMAAKTADDLLAMLIDRLAWWMFYPDWRGLYTWFTSSFLHADPMHLVSNMFFLYLFGSVVEDAVGHWRYLALYVGGAAAAAALYALTELIVPGPAKMSIGASGALAAVMAIFALRFHKTKMRFAYFFMIFFRIRAGTFETTSIVGVGIWAVGELLYGLLQLGGVGSSTAHWAHLGGLVFGGVAAYTLGFIKQASNEYLLDDVAAYSAAGAHGAAASAYAKIAENDAANPFWQLANARERLLAGGAGATGAAEQL
ncbi:MAG: rhomboid family intramembrane serine protease, partial [Actinobacteria bacterium]